MTNVNSIKVQAKKISKANGVLNFVFDDSLLNKLEYLLEVFEIKCKTEIEKHGICYKKEFWASVSKEIIRVGIDFMPYGHAICNTLSERLKSDLFACSNAYSLNK